MKWEKIRKNWKNKVSVKKNFGFKTDTEIGPWFWFPISKPNFGLILLYPLQFFLSMYLLNDP